MTKLRLKIKKWWHRFLKMDGASIAVLIFLTVFAISAIAIFQSQKTSLFSRAATTCPAGIGTYMALAGCEQICGVGNCKSCMLSTTTKYYCDAPIGGGGGGGNGGYNLPQCSGYSTNVKSSCEKEFGAGNCTQCTNDGSTVRWHKGSSNGGSGSSQQCSSFKCSSYFAGKSMNYPSSTIWVGKDGETYGTQGVCEKKGQTINAEVECGLTGSTNSICQSMTAGNPYVQNGGRCYFCNNSKDASPATVELAKCTNSGCSNTTCSSYFQGRTMSNPTGSFVQGKDGTPYANETQCKAQTAAGFNAESHCGVGKAPAMVTCTLPDGQVIGEGGSACANGFNYTCTKSLTGAGLPVKGAACGSSVTVNNCLLPGTTTNKLTEGETRCHTDGFNYTCTRSGNQLNPVKGTSCTQGNPNPNPVMPPTNGHCTPGPIGKNPDGSDKYAEKVPCNLDCSSKCPTSRTAFATSSNAPNAACCYKTAINSCISVAAGLCDNPPQAFIYPQTAVLEQTVTTPVTTIDGQTIRCDQLTCVVKPI